MPVALSLSGPPSDSLPTPSAVHHEARARRAVYIAAKKWDMAAAVASHLVKVDPQTAGWWISLAYALRRTESIEKAEAILLRAQAIHPEVAIIAFNVSVRATPPFSAAIPRLTK